MKKFLALILALVMSLSLVACGGGDTATEETTDDAAGTEEGGTTFEKQTWKFTCSATENTPWADMGREFGELVSEATGGAVTVQVFARPTS